MTHRGSSLSTSSISCVSPARLQLRPLITLISSSNKWSVSRGGRVQPDECPPVVCCLSQCPLKMTRLKGRQICWRGVRQTSLHDLCSCSGLAATSSTHRNLQQMFMFWLEWNEFTVLLFYVLSCVLQTRLFRKRPHQDKCDRFVCEWSSVVGQKTITKKWFSFTFTFCQLSLIKKVPLQTVNKIKLL